MLRKTNRRIFFQWDGEIEQDRRGERQNTRKGVVLSPAH